MTKKVPDRRGEKMTLTMFWTTWVDGVPIFLSGYKIMFFFINSYEVQLSFMFQLNYCYLSEQINQLVNWSFTC